MKAFIVLVIAVSCVLADVSHLANNGIHTHVEEDGYHYDKPAEGLPDPKVAVNEEYLPPFEEPSPPEPTNEYLPPDDSPPPPKSAPPAPAPPPPPPAARPPPPPPAAKPPPPPPAAPPARPPPPPPAAPPARPPPPPPAAPPARPPPPPPAAPPAKAAPATSAPEYLPPCGNGGSGPNCDTADGYDYGKPQQEFRY